MSTRAHPCRWPVLVAIAATLVVTTGCEWRLPGGPGQLCDPATYPRCANRAELLECHGGAGLGSTRCGPADVCLDGVDEGGARWALCAAAGSVPCDPASAAASCVGEAIARCQFPGLATPEACADGGVCVEGRRGAVCAQVGASACDPAADGERCEGERPARCDSLDGLWVFAEACAAPAVCRVNDLGASCADPAATACDPQSFVALCDGDAVVDCGWDSGFTTRTACAADARCRANSYDARCFGPEQPDCDDASFVERCDGTARLYCSSYGVEDRWTCFGGELCRTSAAGAFCVDAVEEACEPASFVRRCDGAQLVTCSSSGFTHHGSCSGLESCRTTPAGAACALADAELCDPATFAARCDGQELVTCNSAGVVQRQRCLEPLACRVSPLAAVCTDSSGPTCDAPFAYLRCEGGAAVLCDWYGFERAEPCGEGAQCVEGALGYLGWSVAAWCVPDSAPSCDGSVTVACAGSAASICLGGRLLEENCGSGSPCVTDGSQWTCAPADAAACEAASFVPRCEDADRLRRCFGEPGVELTQTCQAGCVVDGGAARCGP